MRRFVGPVRSVSVLAAVALAPLVSVVACGGEDVVIGSEPDGGSVVILPDGAVVVTPPGTGTGTGTGTTAPDGAPVPTGTTPPGPAAPLELRYVTGRVTRAVDATTLAQRDVLAASYTGITRTIAGTAWDLRDPSSGRYYAQYSGAGKNGLYSVGTDAKPVQVPFDGNVAALFAQAIYWATTSYAGDYLYLSGRGGAVVAKRKAGDLAFEAPVAIGKDVEIVHDISPNGRLAIVSGVKPFKWGDAENIVAPRMYSMFEVSPDGTLGADVSPQYAALTSIYAQAPHFLQDGSGVVFEGDDDANTGDHLFLYKFGSAAKEFFPKAFRDTDFNTPCALSNGQIAFWESVDTSYYLRVHDLSANATKSAVPSPFPFSGYVRCR